MKEILKTIKFKIEHLELNDAELTESIDLLTKKIELYINIENCLYNSELYLVYKHTDPNGKVYIGITQNHPQTRWNEGGGYEKQSRFYRAIQKYGWINFKHEILAAGLSEEEAKKLENILIIENKSYDEKFGYNTKVSLLSTEQTSVSKKIISTNKKTTPPPKNNSIDISKEIIYKYDVKFINDTIYYAEDGQFFSEKEKPLLHRVLLEDYNLPLRKHTEIIKQIEILSLIDANDSWYTNFQQTYTNDNSIDNWINEQNIQLEDITSLPSTDLYIYYIKWSKTNNTKDTKGKKQFYKYLTEKYNLNRIQKSDGKRYFYKK